jgi:hypothetical protein
MEIENASAPTLKRRTPPAIRIRTYIIIPIVLFVLSASIFKTRQLGITAFVLAVLGLFFVVNQGIDAGYQFAFDDKRMYQRPKGWRWFFRRLPWYAISFNEVSRVDAIYGADAAIKAQFSPFEFILIYGRTGAEGDNVVIYPPAFHENSVKDFLRVFDNRCPGKLPDTVIDYLNSGTPL